MKEQLELKEIVGYLPYGVKAEILDYKSDYVGRQYDKIIGLKEWSKEGDWCLLTDGGSKPSLNRVKPILFPISSLTQFREDLGFVPMVELLAISNNKFRNITQILCETKMYDKREFCTIEYVENGGDASVKSFSYDSSLSRFITRNESEKRPLATGYQLQLFEKLYEWKIDTHNLIEKGLSIAVTEDFNPYK
jgi:hypothetical protein